MRLQVAPLATSPLSASPPTPRSPAARAALRTYSTCTPSRRYRLLPRLRLLGLAANRALNSLLHSKPGARLTHSLFLSCLFGAACILIPTLLLALYVYHLSAAAADRFKTVYNSNLAASLPRHLNTTIAHNFADPSSAHHLHSLLQTSFSVPLAVSGALPVAQRYHLLSTLQAARPQRPSRQPWLLILHVVGSDLTSRLDAISTALTYARNTARVLVVLWDTKDAPTDTWHLNSPHERPPLNPEDPALIYADVHNLVITPNTSHWTNNFITYLFDPPSDNSPLDGVAKLASRHIFCRSDRPLESSYSAMLPGVMLLPTYFEPTATVQRDWLAYLKHWTFPQLDDAGVRRVLNRVYSVPFLFLDAMEGRSQRLLLNLLDQSKSKRIFFVHMQYGMGNRLRALGSALAISRVTGRVPVLIWEPDLHLDCHFSDLFVNEFVIIQKFALEWPPKRKFHRNDDALRNVDFFNFMRNEGKGRHDPMRSLVNPRHGRHIYVKSAYVIRSSYTPRITSTRSKYWKIMREELVPRVEIMLIVLDPMFANIDEMVGVHIRARTIKNDIKGVGKETYGASSQTTDHWRRKTGLKTFEDKIRRLSLKYKYFVAADMKETIEELEHKFGKHRIYSIARETDCVSRDVECAKLALADILLLSKVSILLGSHWSSFSESAVRFSGNVKLLLAGVHFG